MNNALITKMLNKPIKLNGVYYKTYIDLFKLVIRVETYISDNMDKWNRRKSNKMGLKEQIDYNSKLQKEVIKYKAVFNDGSFIEINKTLFEGFKTLNDGFIFNTH